MFGWNVWTTVETMGTSIQIPARAPGLPANLWIHYAFNQTDWGGFPSNGESRSDWSRTTIMGGVGVEPGDIPVASLCCLGIAGIQRETQGIFDTDDWGVAFDTFAPSAPASLQFVGEMATSGKCWPGGIWVAVDVLVLRPSLIPAVPVPYGTYPAPSNRLKWPFETYIALVRNFPRLTGDERKQLRRMNIELEELMDADDQALAEPEKTAVKLAKLSLQIIPTANLADRTAPAIGTPPSANAPQPKAAEKKEPARPAPKPRPRRS
jgi:hypothetical protein